MKADKTHQGGEEKFYRSSFSDRQTFSLKTGRHLVGRGAVIKENDQEQNDQERMQFNIWLKVGLLEGISLGKIIAIIFTYHAKFVFKDYSKQDFKHLIPSTSQCMLTFY